MNLSSNLKQEDILKIAATYHAWRGEQSAGKYEDIAGYCSSIKLKNIQKHSF
jgi:type I restriction enzyme M protein